VESFRIETADERPFPLEVDGDYIGDLEVAEFESAPRSLLAVS
jgi:hypothetical protein